MGRIPAETIDDLRNRVDIVDVIGRVVDLKKAGRNFKGLCPFHDEKTASFNVTPERQMFHCFGCQVGGDAIAFLMRYENLSFPEAARILAGEYGIEIPETASEDQGLYERLFAANEVAQALYRSALASPEGAAARDYLARRGIDAEAGERFGVGYAPNRWDAVSRALESRQIPGEIGEKAGLLAHKRGYYDRLRHRVTFPIQDVRGRVVGFGGRSLDEDQEPKYLNTPESPIFRKREALYGFPMALVELRRAERAIVCEGYFDRIALDRAGLGEAVATCGTALTREHAVQLHRRTRQVVLLFDGDEAGQNAVERSLEILLPEGLRVRAAALPPGQDPDSFLAASGSEALRELVAEAPDALEAVIGRIVAQGCSTPAEKSDAVGRVAPLIAGVSDSVERSEYTRRLAAWTGADPEAVRTVVRSAATGVSAPQVKLADTPPRRHDSRAERHLRELAVLYYKYPSLHDRYGREQVEDLLPDGAWKELVLHLLHAVRNGWVNDDRTIDLFRMQEELDEDARIRLREIVVDDALFQGDVSGEQALDSLMRTFDKQHRTALQRELTRRMTEPGADSEALMREKERLRGSGFALQALERSRAP
jgi:DNA primase